MTRLFTEIERMIPLVQRYFMPLWAVLGEIWSSLWFVLRELWTEPSPTTSPGHLRLVGDFLTNYVLPPCESSPTSSGTETPRRVGGGAQESRLIGRRCSGSSRLLGRCQGCDDRLQRDPGHLIRRLRSNTRWRPLQT